MATISEAFAIAVRHQRAGRLQAAEQIYRQILAVQPNHTYAHNNRGVALKEMGKPDEAVACCRRAVEVKPDFAEAHNNLRDALREQGKRDEAATCYRRAVELRPDRADHPDFGAENADPVIS